MYNPLVLDPKQIKLFASCPKQYSFLVNSGLDTKPKVNIIKELIKQCYINRTQHGYNPQWETIKTRINKHCFGPVDIKDKEAFQKAYRESVNLIGILHYWYFKIFAEDNRTCVVNVPLKIQVSNSFVQSSIDLVALDSKYQMIPILFDDSEIDFVKPYNDIIFKVLMWMIWKETGVFIKKVDHAVVTQDSVQYSSVWNKSSMDTIEKYVTFIVKAIENKVFFPSVGSQCSQCPFEKICSI